MKKYRFFILTLLLIFSITSCNQDILEIEQKGALELKSFYQNATDAEAESLIAAIEKCFYTDAMGVANTMSLNLMSDDHYCGGNSYADQATGYRLFSYYSITQSTGTVKTLYTALYKLNYWCNLIVENIVPETDVKINVIAEAKFYRAVCNMYLVRLWGTPPFVPSSETTIHPENGNPAEIWAWVEQNLTEAAASLPSKYGLGNQKLIGGKPSKEAAMSYLGKAQVLQGKYAEASVTLSSIINSGKYDLLDNYNNLFHHEADFCDEYIFEFNAENDAATGSSQGDMRVIWQNWRFTNMNSPLMCWPTGWGFGQSPTSEFVTFAQTHEAVAGGYSERYKHTLASYDDFLGFDYKDGITPGIKSTVGFVVDNVGYWGYRWMLRMSDVIDGTNNGTASARSHANQPFMRYSDILLLFAEAEINQGRNTGAGLDALNEVRLRAGLPALAAMTLQDVKDERRIELWGEGERFLDLVRWGDASTVLSDVNKYRYEFNGKNADGTYNVSSDGRVYGLGFKSGKSELWPFPETEVLANPNLEQNPGW